MKKDTVEKLNLIQELLLKKEEIEREIEELLNPEPKVPLPANFSINDEILGVLRQAPGQMGAKEILAAIQARFPAVHRNKVNAALVYLSLRKKDIIRVARGLYTIADGQKNAP